MFSAVILSEKGNISGIVIRNRFTKIFNGCPDLGFNYYSLTKKPRFLREMPESRAGTETIGIEHGESYSARK